jgi:hypothetical protein
VDDAVKKPEPLEKALRVRRDARIVCVVCNAIILTVVWVVIRNVVVRYDQSLIAVGRERTVVHWLFRFITLGLLASFLITTALVVRLNKLERERDV